jgi:LmbE family N-acetylglucosaminyl deacetylase
MGPLSRRSLLVASGTLAASADAAATEPRKWKVIVAGGHPGDPEAACGGTVARYADEGHDVAALYLTCGEAGVAGKSHCAAAAIRSAEAKRACDVLKARPLFAEQIDAATEIAAARYAAFRKLIDAEKPDVVFTHWPIDGHRDHRACSLLVYDAWLACGRKFALYYFEVDLGTDTQSFHATHFVDTSATEPRKRAACLAHESQHAATDFYPRQAKLDEFRGTESGFRLAEAFIHHNQSPLGRLP